MNRSYTATLKRKRASFARRVVVALFVLIISGVGIGIASTQRADASSCAGPLAAGEIRVVLVVDATDLGGGSSATCLVVPANTTGSQLLARRGSELGTGSPRYGSSGLLCAIDGMPATGCGDRNAGGFEYWAYFNGTSGSWVYGNFNPFTRRLSDGDIEGWRYVQGAGNGQDPPPRIGPSRSLFPALVAATPAAPELPAFPGTGAPSAAPAQGGTTGGAAPQSPAAESAEGSNAIAAGESSVVSTTVVEAEVVGEVALASSRSTHSNTGRWIGIAAVVALISVMAVGAWWQTRRTRP